MRVTMREPRRSEDGLATLLVGQTYTVSYEFGRYLIGAGFASDTDRSLTVEPDTLTPQETTSVRDRLQERSILCAGGDHPYAQWWGTDGADGLAQMYLDLNIRPYVAICADESSDATSGNGATLGKGNMMTAVQAQELQARGVEFVSHGARHAHWWELWNTGIRVYYTGAEATPTVNISTTQLTLNTATTGATALSLSTYPTLAALAAAVNAVAGWSCILATELLGTEPSTWLVPLNAARSVIDAGGADPTDSNQRFAICAGILIRYTGTAYRDISVSCNSGSNFLSLFADGARILAQSTNTTLTAIVAAINALNVPGLAALVMDNGYAAQTVGGSSTLNPGQKSRETYCYGDENGTHLYRVDNTRTVDGLGLMLTAGCGVGYAFRRQILAVKERAASLYGLTIRSFAQPGGRLTSWLTAPMADEHVQWRTNRGQWTDLQAHLSPHAMPINTPGRFSGHFTSIVATSAATPYTEADVKAIVDALGDTPGWYVNWLNHLCTPTPGDPSPYPGLNQHSPGFYASSADQDEGPFWRELVYAAAARDAGRIDILPPTEAEQVRGARRGPSNLIFNPCFRNGRADNLLGITTTLQGAGGIACPGVALATASGDFAAASVGSDRGLTLQTVGALGANRTPLGWNLFLEPGKTYQIGALLDLTSWGAANTARLVLYPISNQFGPPFPVAQTSMAGPLVYGGRAIDAQCLFTVPERNTPTPARVISKAEPFAFTGGDSITIKMDNLAASAAIVLTGLTTAKAVAAAINTAMAADATYGPKGQYNTVARVEDGRVVIEAPNVLNVEDQSLLELNNSAGTPLAVFFAAGVTVARATSRLHANVDAPFFGYRLVLLLSTTSAQQSLKITAPYCRELRP